MRYDIGDYGMYGMMRGGGGSGMMLFAWLSFILINVVLILAAVALWKYINQNKK